MTGDTQELRGRGLVPRDLPAKAGGPALGTVWKDEWGVFRGRCRSVEPGRAGLCDPLTCSRLQGVRDSAEVHRGWSSEGLNFWGGKFEFGP